MVGWMPIQLMHIVKWLTASNQNLVLSKGKFKCQAARNSGFGFHFILLLGDLDFSNTNPLFLFLISNNFFELKSILILSKQLRSAWVTQNTSPASLTSSVHVNIRYQLTCLTPLTPDIIKYIKQIMTVNCFEVQGDEPTCVGMLLIKRHPNIWQVSNNL